MQPHQERVVNELKELTDKREKLETFITKSTTFSSLEEMEKKRLMRQHLIMQQYEAVLQERIDAFQ